MTPAPLVLDTTDQHRLLGAFAAAIAAGTPVAVLDPAWPGDASRTARDAVAAAASRRRLGSGDLVLFTSGSTDRPRGVVRTAASWQASVGPLADLMQLEPRDRLWLPGPLSSSLFLYGAWHATRVGAGVLLRDDDAVDASVVHCVPSQLPGVLARRDAGRLPRLRLAVVAGDRLSVGLRRACTDAGVRVLEYYGAAELSFVAFADENGAMRPFPGVQVAARSGVLWARSPYLARGYLAAEGTGPMRRDGEGWATVGDLGTVVAEGIEVRGRGGAAVTTGGHTVVVEDVEDALRAVIGVTDVGVCGLPHPALGNQLVAVVVGDAADDALRAAARRFPAPARPRRWLRASALPRTSAGKLRRPELVVLATTLTAR